MDIVSQPGDERGDRERIFPGKLYPRKGGWRAEKNSGRFGLQGRDVAKLSNNACQARPPWMCRKGGGRDGGVAEELLNNSLCADAFVKN